jgi:predicted nuclease of predicted toxin-antitoxin system
VRILLDEQLPRRLIRQLAPHQVRTVQQQGWAGLRNGELLRRAAAQGFEIFLTGDQNFQFQQNLRGSSICALVLIARSIKIEDLLPLVPSLLEAIRDAQPGEVRQVSAP